MRLFNDDAIIKIKEVLFRHKKRIDDLERRIELLENDPFKMPFD